VHRYKFQAFITLGRAADATPGETDQVPAPALPPGQMQRMGLRGEHHQTHASHFFSALVANNGDSSAWLGDDHAIVTVMLSGADYPEDYFSAGDHFALWLGTDVADGVVTRRLFT
jgi:hypothetical protein